jgi:hypothetical protein
VKGWLKSTFVAKSDARRVPDNKIGLRKEILAAGVARAQGMTIKDAARIVPGIIASAKELLGRKPKT